MLQPIAEISTKRKKIKIGAELYKEDRRFICLIAEAVVFKNLNLKSLLTNQ